MPRNDELTENPYRAYRKTHGYGHPLDEERAIRELRDAGTHKRRLKGLARHVDDSETPEGDA